MVINRSLTQHKYQSSNNHRFGRSYTLNSNRQITCNEPEHIIEDEIPIIPSISVKEEIINIENPIEIKPEEKENIEHNFEFHHIYEFNNKSDTVIEKPMDIEFVSKKPKMRFVVEKAMEKFLIKKNQW
jgi:hypothetical protein